jgi:hypothetical protein
VFGVSGLEFGAELTVYCLLFSLQILAIFGWVLGSRVVGGQFSEGPGFELAGRVPLRAVPIGTVLNLRSTTSQKCEAVLKKARI